jgi:hypothetical protein
MKDVTTGTDTRAPRSLHPPLLGIDLAHEIDQLSAEPAWAEHGRTAKTLAKSATFRVVLTLLRAGGSIGDDDVWSPLTVQILGGRVHAEQGDASIAAGPGSLVWFEEGPGWTVRADEDAALLISLTWPPERTGEPAFTEPRG